MTVKVGDFIEIKESVRLDNESYTEFTGQYKVKKVSFSERDHPYYDNVVGGPLIDCEGLDFSLYDYEFDIVDHRCLDYRQYLDPCEKCPRCQEDPRTCKLTTNGTCSNCGEIIE